LRADSAPRIFLTISCPLLGVRFSSVALLPPPSTQFASNRVFSCLARLATRRLSVSLLLLYVAGAEKKRACGQVKGHLSITKSFSTPASHPLFTAEPLQHHFRQARVAHPYVHSSSFLFTDSPSNSRRSANRSWPFLPAHHIYLPSTLFTDTDHSCCSYARLLP
jgi:hypothetical protein